MQKCGRCEEPGLPGLQGWGVPTDFCPTDRNPDNKEIIFSKELIESISMNCREEEKQTNPKNPRTFVSKLLAKQDMLYPEDRTRNQTEFI